MKLKDQKLWEMFLYLGGPMVMGAALDRIHARGCILLAPEQELDRNLSVLMAICQMTAALSVGFWLLRRASEVRAKKGGSERGS